jgi:hypothetical protein
VADHHLGQVVRRLAKSSSGAGKGDGGEVFQFASPHQEGSTDCDDLADTALLVDLGIGVPGRPERAGNRRGEFRTAPAQFRLASAEKENEESCKSAR